MWPNQACQRSCGPQLEVALRICRRPMVRRRHLRMMGKGKSLEDMQRFDYLSRACLPGPGRSEEQRRLRTGARYQREATMPPGMPVFYAHREVAYSSFDRKCAAISQACSSKSCRTRSYWLCVSIRGSTSSFAFRMWRPCFQHGVPAVNRIHTPYCSSAASRSRIVFIEMVRMLRPPVFQILQDRFSDTSKEEWSGHCIGNCFCRCWPARSFTRLPNAASCEGLDMLGHNVS